MGGIRGILSKATATFYEIDIDNVNICSQMIDGYVCIFGILYYVLVYDNFGMSELLTGWAAGIIGSIAIFFEIVGY